MITEIWQSFRRLPGWVQIWVICILVPANLLPLGFLDQPYGLWIACLSIAGMVPNLPIIIVERGFSKRMAIPHVVIWTPLVFLLIWLGLWGPPVTAGYAIMLAVLVSVDLISLAFDYVDAIKWHRGDRGIA